MEGWLHFAAKIFELDGMFSWKIKISLILLLITHMLAPPPLTMGGPS